VAVLIAIGYFPNNESQSLQTPYVSLMSALQYRDPVSRMRWALLAILILMCFGTFGYVLIEGFTVFDGLYMTIITLSTVGFGEIHTLSPAGRLFTAMLILSGVGTLAYGVSQIAELVIESKVFLQKRREAAVQKMNDHVIICGFGRIGKKVCERLRERKMNFVVIEQNDENISLLEKHDFKYIVGDARDDSVLLKAGISNAATIVATLSSDADNVYVVLSARNLNGNLYIVARAGQMVSYGKLKQAGADRVISPYEIGADYIASAVARPSVIDFMEVVSKTATNRKSNLEIDEIFIPAKSSLAGKLLRETDLRTSRNIIVLAMKDAGGVVTYNPSSEHVIEENGTLICIGFADQLDQFAKDVKPQRDS
jgi:voltage-gated potassium channel